MDAIKPGAAINDCSTNETNQKKFTENENENGT